MGRIESTKGAAFEKFLVVSCDGKETLQSARTLAEATTILADLSDEGACYVTKILRTVEGSDPIEAFDTKVRPVRYVKQAVSEPPHVETEQDIDDEVVEEKPVPPPEEPKPKKARKPKKKKPVEEEVSITEVVADITSAEEAPPLEI